MNKAQYIAALKGALRGRLAAGEIDDIVRDYMEFFDDGVMQGRSEEDVAEELGNPLEVARQILSEEKEPPVDGPKKVPGIDFSGITEKISSSADKFASSANEFTKRKMKDRAEKPPKPPRQPHGNAQERSGAGQQSGYGARDNGFMNNVASGIGNMAIATGGCLMMFIKFILMIIFVPLAMIVPIISFVVGSAGVFALIAGVVAVSALIPLLPTAVMVTAFVGLLFAICLSITIILASIYYGGRLLAFLIDAFSGRTRYYNSQWYVAPGVGGYRSANGYDPSQPYGGNYQAEPEYTQERRADDGAVEDAFEETGDEGKDGGEHNA